MKRPRSIYPLLFLLQLAIVAAFAIPSAEQSADLLGLQRRISVNLVNPANSGRIYFYQPALSADLNVPSRLNVQLDTGGANINSVGVDITYPKDKVDVSTFDLSQSFCSLVLTNQIDPEQGVITLNCGTPNPGLKTQIGTIGSILYTPKVAGTVTFHIEPTTASVLTNDGVGTNIVRSTEDLTLTINEPKAPVVKPTTPVVNPTPTPKPVVTPLRKVPLTSVSHPASTTCSTKKEATFAWIKEKGVESFEYEFNNSVSTFNNPKTTTETSLTVPTLPNTSLTFHLRAIRGTEKSEQSTIVIKTCATTTPKATPTTHSVQLTATNKTKPGIFRSIFQKAVNSFSKLWR